MVCIRHGRSVREKAYRAWKECGGSLDKAASRLKEQGEPVNRSTINRWKLRYNWKEQVRREELEERIRRETGSEDAARLIADLEAQKARYERFFGSLGENGIDVHATYAYTSLVKAIADVRKKIAQKPDIYAMTPFVMDEFVTFIKADDVAHEVRSEVFGLIDRFFEEVKPQ